MTFMALKATVKMYFNIRQYGRKKSAVGKVKQRKQLSIDADNQNGLRKGLPGL